VTNAKRLENALDHALLALYKGMTIQQIIEQIPLVPSLAAQLADKLDAQGWMLTTKGEAQ
jgi:hypothetical protein